MNEVTNTNLRNELLSLLNPLSPNWTHKYRLAKIGDLKIKRIIEKIPMIDA